MITGPGAPGRTGGRRTRPSPSGPRGPRGPHPGPEPPHDVRWEARLERWLRIGSRWRRWWDANVARGRQPGRRRGRRRPRLARAVLDGRVGDRGRARARPARSSSTSRTRGRSTRCWSTPRRAHRRLELPPDGSRAARGRPRRHEHARGAAARARRVPGPRRRTVSWRSATRSTRPTSTATRAPGRRTARVFRIVHTGSLHTALGPPHREAGRLRRLIGGVVPGRRLPHALARLPARGRRATARGRPDARRPDRGRTSPASSPRQDRAVAERHPFVPPARVRAAPRDGRAAALGRPALPARCTTSPTGRRAGLVPQKTYEYLGRRPADPGRRARRRRPRPARRIGGRTALSPVRYRRDERRDRP